MKVQVRYNPSMVDDIRVGWPALLWNVIDHPSGLVSNIPGTPVYTSPVQLIEYTGGKIFCFETLNTVYIADCRGQAKKEGITNIDDLE